VPKPSELLRQTRKVAFLSGFDHRSEIREGRCQNDMCAVSEERGELCERRQVRGRERDSPRGREKGERGGVKMDRCAKREVLCVHLFLIFV